MLVRLRFAFSKFPAVCRGLPNLEVATQQPGKFLRGTVARLREYFVGQQGAGAERKEQLAAIFTPYLTSVLNPRLKENQRGNRNGRELLTLAATLDALVVGDLDRVGDLLVTRFKAVETATQEGHWGVAQHHELLGDGRVSAVSPEELESALRAEASALRLSRLAAGR